MDAEVEAARQALRTPRAAAISGIVFSVLLTASLVLVRLALPGDSKTEGDWISNAALRNSVLAAANLVPFAGIAFLWFIGVVRDRMGQREDRFFATVFLGSGLLFVAMLFAATAMAAGLIASASTTAGNAVASEAWRIGRAVTYTLITTYAMRMAAVFTIATATITLRIAILPRWVGVLGYVCAVVLLLSVGYLPWVEELFPAWVFVVSVNLLLASLRMSRGTLPRGSVGEPVPSEG